MKTTINNYLNDGACRQSKAVLAMMGNFQIEQSWNKDRAVYDAEVEIARWENCREQGYVAMLNVNKRQLNIAFFEHRNSDSICAVKWEQMTMNAPTINSAKFGDVYKDKYDVSHSVGYGKVTEMAEWIRRQFSDFYTSSLSN